MRGILLIFLVVALTGCERLSGILPAGETPLQPSAEPQADVSFGQTPDMPAGGPGDAVTAAPVEPPAAAVSDRIAVTRSGSLNGPLPDLSGETPDALIGGGADGIAFTVLSLPDGAVLAHRNALQRMLPASTAKLITALAVLDRLAPDHRFVTRVCLGAEGLVLVGGGDPTLGVEDLLSLAIQAHRSGLLTSGMRLFYYPGVDAGPIDPMQPADAAYNPRLSSLMVAEGAYRALPTWSLPAGAPPFGGAGGASWQAHPNPTRQAAGLLRDYLDGLGHSVDLAGSPDDDACPLEVSRHESDPVSTLVNEMLWTSSNPMAELLGQAALNAPDPMDWIEERYGHSGGIELPNFSGLSSHARVNAYTMARLLAFAWRDMPDFAARLTPAGWDGSLRHRLGGPETGLRIWAKTGSMNYGIGLAGFAFPDRHPPVAFAIYAFEPDARAAYDPIAMDPSAAAEAAADTWNGHARRRIDSILERLMRNLSNGSM